MFNFFKSKKERDIDNLQKSLLLGEITHNQYREKLHDIDYDKWFNTLPEKEQKVIKLNKSLNNGTISKIEYVSQMKDIDTDIWLSLLEGEELQKAELDVKLNSGKITKDEYNKEIATLNKEPFIAILKFGHEDERIYMEFDWNAYFIEELRSKGFEGPTEEDIVNEWFNTLATMIASESEKVIVTDPDDMRKIMKKSGKTEHY